VIEILFTYVARVNGVLTWYVHSSKYPRRILTLRYCNKVNNPPAVSDVSSSTGSGSSGDAVGSHADGGKQKEQVALDDRSTHAKAHQVIAVGGGRYDAEGILTLP
jgi:hypothetical protein